MSIEALFPFARFTAPIVDEAPSASPSSGPLKRVDHDAPTSLAGSAGDLEAPAARDAWEKDRYDLDTAVIFSRAADLRGLLERGVSPTMPDADGCLPLSFAVVHQNPEVLRLLLAHGADPLKVDAGGLCPMELAEALGNDVAIDVLLEHFGLAVRPLPAQAA